MQTESVPACVPGRALVLACVYTREQASKRGGTRSHAPATRPGKAVGKTGPQLRIQTSREREEGEGEGRGLVRGERFTQSISLGTKPATSQDQLHRLGRYIDLATYLSICFGTRPTMPKDRLQSAVVSLRLQSSATKQNRCRIRARLTTGM